MNAIRRFRASLFLSMAVGVALVWLASSQQTSKTPEPAIDLDAYYMMKEGEVADLHALEDYFTRQQLDFRPLLPPAADFILRQAGMPDVLPFDPAGFPDEFRKGLIEEYEFASPVYFVEIIEDPISRATLFVNRDGKELYRLPAPQGYDPFDFLKSMYPRLYSGAYSSDVVKEYEALYDPARIRIRVKLLPSDYVEPYLYTMAKVQAYEQEMRDGDDEGGGMMMLMGESESNIVMSAITKLTNGQLAVRVAYPEDFTNRLDIFFATDLMDRDWKLAADGLSTTGTNVVTFVTTNAASYTRGFFAAGNADRDSDEDGYIDARERFLYKTDPADPDSHPVVLSGVITYDGPETGPIHVLAVTDADSWSKTWSVTLPGPGSYTNLVANQATYWFKAFMDVNGNQSRDIWEPQGLYSGGSLYLTTDVSNLDIALEDQPSIWGTVDYTGSVTGNIYVLATALPDWNTTYSAVIPWLQGEASLTGDTVYVSFPVEYSLTGLPPGNYFIRAFIDEDDDGLHSHFEPNGQYHSGPVAVSNRMTGMDIVMTGDADGDGIPDWWKTLYFGGPTNALAWDDPDGDGYLNIYEYIYGSDPLSASSIPAPTIVVTNGGSATIQSAINASTNEYDIIAIGPGTYAGDGNRNISFQGKTITLISTHGPEQTIIDVEGWESGFPTVWRGFAFTNAETRASVLAGFTIKNGAVASSPSPPMGGAILCENSSPTIFDCVAASNTAWSIAGSSYGGGMACIGSSAPVLRHCEFRGNAAAWGGGLYYAVTSSNAAMIANVLISDNGLLHVGEEPDTLLIWTSFGGGGYLTGQVFVTNCVFRGNLAGWSGGGLIAGSNVTLTASDIISNVVGLEGGGLLTSGVIEDCVIQSNVAYGDSFLSLGYGAGVSLSGGSLMRYSVIKDNTLHSGGGAGVSMQSSTAGSSITVEACQISDNIILNHEDYRGGGGIYIRNTTPSNSVIFTIAGSLIANNQSAGQGGGIYSLGAAPRITDCIIEGNEADIGGGMYLRGGIFEPVAIEPLLTNSTVLFNHAVFDGGGVFVHGADPVLANCDISYNSAARGGAVASIPLTSPVFIYPDYFTNTFGSSPLISSSTLSHNAAVAGGSAVYLRDAGGDPGESVPSHPKLYESRIHDNQGAVAILAEGPNVHAEIRNVYLGANASPTPQSGIMLSNAHMVVLNSTIAGNRGAVTAIPKGSALYSHNNPTNTTTLILNSIVWDNIPHADQIFANHTNAIVSHSLHMDDYDPQASNHLVFAQGNITNNPQLIYGGYLLYDSPAINAADTNDAPDIDILGQSRPVGGGDDMGSYEFKSTTGDELPDWWVIQYFGEPDAVYATNVIAELGMTYYEAYIGGIDPINWETEGLIVVEGEEGQGYDPTDPNSVPVGDWLVLTGDQGPGIAKTTGNRVLTIPPGETRLLVVALHSEEFPHWTGQPSQYNDQLSWIIQPQDASTVSGSINVNNRHAQWLQGTALLGFSPVHIEHTSILTAPTDSVRSVIISLTAMNVADGILPSTVIAGLAVPRNQADDSDSHDPGYDETRDPINVINGNVTLTERDLFLPATGIPLGFSRNYHSRNTETNAPLGPGWRHAYQLHLEHRPVSVYKGIGGDWIVLAAPDGQRHWFREDGESYSSPPENNLRLLRTGDWFRVESPGGLTRVFDTNGVLHVLKDAFNNRVDLTYTGDWPTQKLDRVEHANGQFIEFAYTNTRIAGITTPSTNLFVSLRYDAEGRLTNVVRHVCGRNESFVYRYDATHGVLTQRVNALGHRFDYGYEVVLGQGARGISMRLETNFYAHTVNYTNQGPNRSEVAYFRNGETQAFVYAYDPVQKAITSILGPNSSDIGTLLVRDADLNVVTQKAFDLVLDEFLVTIREYDDRNNVLSESFGYNADTGLPAWQFAWNETWETPTHIVDPDGLAMQWAYDKGRVTVARLVADGEDDIVTTFGYFTNGLLSAVTNAAGHATRWRYDANGNPTNVIPPVGPTVRMDYGALGHLERLSLPFGGGWRHTHFTNDAAGRVRSLTYPDNRTETFHYDLMGRLTNHVDVAGRTNRFEYLPAGRLAKATRFLTNGTPVSIQTDYDNQFNLLRVIDPLGRNVETYALDIQDRVVAVTNLEGQVMTIDYGVADIVHGVTRFDGTVVGNTYDEQARLIAQTLPGLTNEFAYTSGGRLTSASSAGVTVSNVYDGFGRLLAQHQHGAGLAQTVEYTWHPVGTASNITTTAGTWTHRYDPADRLTNLVSGTGSFTWSYNPDNGLPSVRTADTGLKVERQYDVLDRLTNLVWRNASNHVIRSFGYAYNHASMITNIVREDGERRVFEYDGIDRLISERIEGATTNETEYVYDLAGNRLQRIDNGTPINYTLGMGNKLSSFGATGSLLYDAAGNVTNAVYDDGRDLALSWDGAYRLTSASNTMAGGEFYGYDAFARRIWISNGVETNHLIYAGPHVVAETDSAGVVTRSYTYGPGIDNILSMTVHDGMNTTTFWYVTDHLNTVWALVDESGTVVESYDYDAWGNVSVYDGSGAPLTESAVGNRFLFQGREFSWTTGLYYFRARYFDPETGRFLSKDLIGIAGGINLYQAFSSNPVMFIDPFGLRDYTEAQTQMILRNAVREYKLSSWPSALMQARSNHGTRGKYDYSLGAQSADTFTINGRTLVADQFGNYVAGYATYARFGKFGETMTRTAGHWYELLKFGNPYWLDDPGSREMISLGIRDFRNTYRHWNDMRYPDNVWQSIYDQTMSDKEAK